jgi:hypothetical protein
VAFLRTMALGATIGVDIAGSAVGRIGALGKSVDGLRKSLGFTSMGAMSAVGALGGLTVAGAGVTAGLGFAFSKAAEFEHQMAAVRAVAGASSEEFAELTRRAKELGASTKFSATEVGQGMEIMARAGFTTKETLAGIEGVLVSTRPRPSASPTCSRRAPRSRTRRSWSSARE